MGLQDKADTAVRPKSPTDVPARLDRLPVMLPHIVWISLLTANLTLEYYDNALFAYVIPAIIEDTAFDLGQIGLIGSAFFGGMIVGALVGGRLSDRFGRRWVLVWSTALYSVGALMTALAPNFELMLVARVITGIGVQAATSALLVYIAEMFPTKSRGRFVSIVTLAFVIIAPVVALLAFAVIPNAGPDAWRHLFMWGSVGLLIAPLVRLLMPESVRWYVIRGNIGKATEIVERLEARALRRGPLSEPQPVPTGPKELTLRRLLANKGVLRTTAVLSAGYFGSTLGLYLFQNWALYALVDGLEYPEVEAYEIQLIWNVVYVITPVIGLLLMDRVERKTLVFAASLVTAIPLGVLGVSTNSSAVVVSGGLAGIVTGLVVTVYYAYIPEVMPTNARGLGSGIIMSMGKFGGAASGVLGAAVYGGWGVAGLMITAAVSYIVFSIIVLVFGPRTTGRSLEGVVAEELRPAAGE
ncbi:MFS transporter [Saccharopolyspora sp. 5N102]|uniref:MFS transporter n=1 Tax=Saccharopolyspora sp. 5N102 TaxID=3375155 RepID=UPI0037B06CEB